MQGRGSESKQVSFLMNGLREMLNPEHEVYRLSEAMPWESFEREFSGMYSTTGRPAKPVRLMVGLLLLKQMYDLGDETVVEQWVQNPYWQFFCGEVEFRWELPCEPSDLVHFRKRIGEKGVLKILEGSIQMHGKKAHEEEILVDTTVQGKGGDLSDGFEAAPKDRADVLENRPRRGNYFTSDVSKRSEAMRHGAKRKKTS